MVAPKHYRKHAAFGDVAEGECNLVKALLDIGGDDLDISGVHHGQGFFQIDAPLRVIAIAERGDAPQGIGTKACPWTDGGAGIEWGADKNNVLAPKLAHVREKRDLHECVASAERPGFAAEECERTINDAWGSFQAKLLGPLGPLSGLLPAQLRLPLHSPGATEVFTPDAMFAAIVIVFVRCHTASPLCTSAEFWGILLCALD